MFDEDDDDSNIFELTVMMVDGNQIIVDTKPTDTIEDVKINLIDEVNRTSYEPFNLEPSQLKLLHGHIQLEDDSTVAECGLGIESIIVTDSKCMCHFVYLPSDGVFLIFGKGGIWELLTSKNQDAQDKTCIKPRVRRDKGSYECSITGLRWEIKSAITIDYRYCSWNEYAPIIVIKQSEFSGPLFNIVAEDNIVTAVHLPHFICLKDRTLSYTFAIFHVKERSYNVQKPSEVHQSHIALKMPTFSLMGVIVDKHSSLSFHCVAMIYQSQYTDAHILHVYVVPNDVSIIQAVHLQESNSRMIEYPSKIESLYFGRKYSLLSSSDVLITPEVS
ncbi:hypothetical protein chiPu_0015277 [Chiloscyllium punctatum]|uniref:Ubiquitin-like domain-containing protein n=1 Tax=Chiloscyllium punctatum TaxID=137246 RepID=A0A401T294_CHIPU|nr:hypothetical protein [Chiloscyllium punctatum]